MGLYEKLSGYMELELTSACLEQVYQDILSNRIPIYSVSQDDMLTARFVISRKNYQALRNISDSRGWGLRISKRKGIYWQLRLFFGRPVLILAAIACFCLTLFLSSTVLFVEVEGNDTVPARYILDSAENCGISIGAERRRVRSEEVKNQMLSLLPQLKWVGVNTVGCRAIVSVQERDASAEIEREPICNIIAKQDGIIDSVVVTRGTPLCKPGQAVREGQVLISGYTDCDFTMIATRAEGEIYARTIRPLSVITPGFWRERTEISGTKTRYSILIGKNRINLWKGSGICPATCGRIYKEYYISLPGGFRLPAALAVEQLVYYTDVPAAIPGGEERLSAFASEYLSELMTAGYILQKSETVLSRDDSLFLEGAYYCREMIGAVQPEQIGENYGEIN